MRVEEVGGHWFAVRRSGERGAVVIPLKGQRCISSGLDGESGCAAGQDGAADGLLEDDGRGRNGEARGGAGDEARKVADGEGVVPRVGKLDVL